MTVAVSSAEFTLSGHVRDLVALTKPRVTLLAVFCAVIGMFLATEGMVPYRVLVAGSVGIWLVAAAGFVLNCLIERSTDARMIRTARRPIATGRVKSSQALIFAAALGCAGSSLLFIFVNPLTMWLTIATFVAYALIYTMVLKPATPQNIVIGGASGAMPPLLGWVAVANDVSPPALVLFLIVFVWTPPHFWALAMYRVEDYRRSGLPMLPVTHGHKFTGLSVFLYTLLLIAVSILPYLIQMSGLVYLVSALALGAIFLWRAWNLWRHYTDRRAQGTFQYSVIYLTLLFAALLVDHYVW